MLSITAAHNLYEMNIMFGLLWRMLKQNGEECHKEIFSSLPTNKCAANDSDWVLVVLWYNKYNLMLINYITYFSLFWQFIDKVMSNS
jgi:hypothetical protein